MKEFNGSEEVSESAKSLAEKLSPIEEELIQTKSKSNQDPLNFPIKLNNKLAALPGVIARGDRGATVQSLAVFKELSLQLQAQLDALQAVMATDVPAFNELVKAQEVPAIVLEPQSPTVEEEPGPKIATPDED